MGSRLRGNDRSNVERGKGEIRFAELLALLRQRRVEVTKTGFVIAKVIIQES